MAKLLDVLNADALGQLLQGFSDTVGSPIRIVAPDGRVLAGRARPAGVRAQAEVMLAGEHVASVVLAGSAKAGVDAQVEVQQVRMLGLVRDVVAQICEQAAQLQDRVEELAAMYRLTEEFTGKTNLKQVHHLVAETMVKVTGAGAASIRVLSEDRTELLTMAAYGLSSQYMSKGKILLSESIIDREVLEGKVVYIADERKDERILYKTQARREGLVSALCVPMAYKGQIEGVIRVYTRKLHSFDWFETSLIKGVAAQAASAIVNARLYHEALESERIRRQVTMAAEVQRRMVPSSPPKAAGLDVSAIFVPCFELGGDFYDFIELPNQNWGIAVADVVGKGVRASLLMAAARAALRAYAKQWYNLSDVLSALNVHMSRESGASDFITLFYGVLDAVNRRLTYCSAGHEPPLLVRDGRISTLEDSFGGVLGVDEEASFRPGILDLRKDDVLVIYTDGLLEAMNFRDEIFGRQRTLETVLTACRQNATADAIGKQVLWEVRRFTGLQTRSDDLTLLTIKVQ